MVDVLGSSPSALSPTDESINRDIAKKKVLTYCCAPMYRKSRSIVFGCWTARITGLSVCTRPRRLTQPERSPSIDFFGGRPYLFIFNNLWQQVLHASAGSTQAVRCKKLFRIRIAQIRPRKHVLDHSFFVRVPPCNMRCLRACKSAYSFVCFLLSCFLAFISLIFFSSFP